MSRNVINASYVVAVILAGTAALGLLLAGLNAPPTAEVLACGTLAFGVLVGEAFPVRIGGDAGEVAFSSTFSFALLLGWGPGIAMAAQVGACLIVGVAHG